ncbi:protein FAR1-RELATED SEQUENCE 5-like [Apium graveolens]|uniref:protein FAR1-RELATED SEQUENCE 5-like n=1 Tax=Apium graveolens TaxID=4045 RepID=UPI003D79C82E
MGVSSRSNGKYKIFKFISEHSHDLISPSKSHFLRSHESLNDIQKSQIEMAHSSGIAPKTSTDLLSQQAGGSENVGFIRDDYKNYLRTKRTIQMKFGETCGVLEYLKKKQAEDPNFTYVIQVDVENLITNIFWVDVRMKVEYDRFGDVICFDTKYRKKTFEWLFDTFARVMSGRKPSTILIDQDAAMDNALSTQWPKNKYRLCVCQMYQNAAKHLNSIFDKFKSFAKEFNNCVYDHDDVFEFTRAWDNMLEKYNLKDNEWL